MPVQVGLSATQPQQGEACHPVPDGVWQTASEGSDREQRVWVRSAQDRGVAPHHSQEAEPKYAISWLKEEPGSARITTATDACATSAIAGVCRRERRASCRGSSPPAKLGRRRVGKSN